ncbi:efflux RND transporter permease subunit [Paracoccus marcusii]|uniref:efflux RND transporter permease subunit n=1 Tax=Paracoccus marcusii TaxID=59779 RepID=UPI002ED37E89|nr:efflux RND transporter permease subunit [Paracoccus marcusii]
MVGLIGMSGIIINDSIVLISTIDEYRATRALRPAIVDAVADRFRPVLLTTATTVLGLAPLLYERSSQALFLAHGGHAGLWAGVRDGAGAAGRAGRAGRGRRSGPRPPGLRRSLRAGPVRGVMRGAVVAAVAGWC